MTLEPALLPPGRVAVGRFAGESEPLAVAGLTKIHCSQQRTVTAFENLELSLCQGEIVVVVGPSGWGKSSLLRCIAGPEPVTQGTVRAGGQIVSSPIPHIGFVFQQPVLFPWLTVRQNIEFGLALKNGPRLEKQRRATAFRRERLH